MPARTIHATDSSQDVCWTPSERPKSLGMALSLSEVVGCRMTSWVKGLHSCAAVERRFLSRSEGVVDGERLLDPPPRLCGEIRSTESACLLDLISLSRICDKPAFHPSPPSGLPARTEAGMRRRGLIARVCEPRDGSQMALSANRKCKTTFGPRMKH
ncbi:hypothetical protein EJ07DRAFT_153689 [Lizonia empirigonia]|nr:hypothetical protein EJ07DRAFT_153689 [Lizonia empirigonia]